MSKRLSYSAIVKYLTCPASYNYYYNHGIVPVRITSALVFGAAMDAALNCVLLDDGKPGEAYRKVWDEFKDVEVEFSKYDFDPDLGEDVHESLFNKAKLLVREYRQVVLPNIERVIEVQAKAGPGILDAHVVWKGIGEVIADHKTSGTPYRDDAAAYSAQLGMYAAEKKVNNVAYIVLLKQVQKNKTRECEKCGYDATGRRFVKCPECGANEWTETIDPQANIQVLHATLERRALEVAAETEASVKKAIGAGAFHCNVANCNSQYGRPCEYKALHWYGKMDGLKKRKKK